jgi:Flp pilus assembly protein TadG
MIAMRRPSLVSCVNATTAVEFAIILPAFVMLLLGIMYGSLVVYTAASMHYAVEGAARCYSAETSQYSSATNCVSATTTQSYAQTLYLGPGSPTFTASIPGCGHQVTATLNVVLSSGMANWNIPLSSTACFP